MFAIKFGYPQGILTRIGDYRDVPSLWWLDPEKARRYDEAHERPVDAISARGPERR